MGWVWVLGVWVWMWVFLYTYIPPLFSRASKNLPPPITKTMLTKCHSHSLSLSLSILTHVTLTSLL